MTRFFALFAIAALIPTKPPMLSSTFTQTVPAHKAADRAADREFDSISKSEDTPKFIADYVPTECTVQFGYVARGDLLAQLAQEFAQTMDALMLNQPIAECDAITGTDDGKTKNFNFAHANSGIYKVITKSTPTYDEQNSLYTFDVIGVQLTPISAEGDLEPSKTLLSVSSGLCEADSLEAPQNVFCEFAAIGANEGELAVGQLSYFH